MRAIYSILAGTLALAGLDAVLSVGGSANYGGMLGAVRTMLTHVLDPGVALLPDRRSATSSAAPPAAPAPSPAPAPGPAVGPGGTTPFGGTPIAFPTYAATAQGVLA